MNDDDYFEHIQVTYQCPLCGDDANEFTCELRKNPQIICPVCNCQYTVDVDEIIERYKVFTERVQKLRANLPPKINR